MSSKFEVDKSVVNEILNLNISGSTITYEFNEFRGLLNKLLENNDAMEDETFKHQLLESAAFFGVPLSLLAVTTEANAETKSNARNHVVMFVSDANVLTSSSTVVLTFGVEFMFTDEDVLEVIQTLPTSSANPADEVLCRAAVKTMAKLHDLYSYAKRTNHANNTDIVPKVLSSISAASKYVKSEEL